MKINKYIITIYKVDAWFKRITVMVSRTQTELLAIIGIVLTVVMEDGSALFLGFLISNDRTVSISKSFRPSLLVFGLKQQPPENSID